MDEVRYVGPGNRDEIHTLALRQWSVVTTAQMKRRGVSGSAIGRSVAAGRLHPLHHGVYSTIDPSLMSFEARLAAAILAGGRGASMCARTASWWLDLISRRPDEIDIAISGQRRPAPGIRWHRLALGAGEVMRHKRMPTTTVGRTLLDLAAVDSVRSVRRALAEAEYHHGVPAEAVAAALRRGHAGSATLRAAISTHIPQLAQTRSHLEAIFVELLHANNLEIPAINHPAGSSTVDCLWTKARIAVELDGVRGHAGERRVLRDHRRDLHRRAEGLTALRYHYTQVTREAALVVADLRRAGVPPRV